MVLIEIYIYKLEDIQWQIGKFIVNFRLVGVIQLWTRSTTKVALAMNIDYALCRPFIMSCRPGNAFLSSTCVHFIIKLHCAGICCPWGPLE